MIGNYLIQKDVLIQSYYLPTMGGQLVVTSDEDVDKLHNLVLWRSLSSAFPFTNIITSLHSNS